MLRKRYLVSPDYLNTVTSNNSSNTPNPSDKIRKASSEAGKKHNSSKRRRTVKKIKTRREYDRWVTKRSAARRDYDKWFKVRGKLYEADVERKRKIKTVADFLKQVLPSSSSSSKLNASHSGTQTELGPAKRYINSESPAAIPAKGRIAFKTPTTTTKIPSTSSEVIYEASTPQLSIKRDVDDDDVSTDDLRVEPNVIDYGAMTLGALASLYVSPYLYECKRRGLDTEYGIRRDGDGFMIGDSRFGVDRDGNIHNRNVEFPAKKGLL